MNLMQQLFNLIVGLMILVIVISSIISGALWLSDKMSKDDRDKTNS